MGELCFNNGRTLPLKKLTTMAELYDKENTLQQWENFASMMVEVYNNNNKNYNNGRTLRYGKHFTTMGELCFNNSRTLP